MDVMISAIIIKMQLPLSSVEPANVMQTSRVEPFVESLQFSRGPFELADQGWPILKPRVGRWHNRKMRDDNLMFQIIILRKGNFQI